MQHMSQQDYSTSIFVTQNPEAVYAAINKVRGWWSEEIVGRTDVVNQEWFYHYKDVHLCKVKVIDLIKNTKVVWEIVENSFNFTDDANEWTGDRIIFDITKEGNQTRITFTQVGLTPQYECFEICRAGWNNYINNSLYQLITKGKGAPNPKEGDGFNKTLADKWKLN